MAPTVSVIIPCYNEETRLGRAIRSVRQQSFRDWELLVVDDGSEDGSVAVAREQAATDPRIRVLAFNHLGQYTIRNIGVERSRGRWIQFLDADDWLHEEKIDRQLDLADEHRAADPAVVLYGDYEVVSTEEVGTRVERVEVGHETEEALLRSMLHWRFQPDAPLLLGSCLLSRSVFQGRSFEERLDSLADNLFLIDLLLDGVEFLYTPILGLSYHQHGGNITADQKFVRRAYFEYLGALAERDPALVRETRNIPHLLDEALKYREREEFRRAVSLLRSTGLPTSLPPGFWSRTRLRMLCAVGGRLGYAGARAGKSLRRRLGRLKGAAKSVSALPGSGTAPEES